MADDDSNLVSQVSITGTEDAAAKLKVYADSGAASFDKINTAANTSAKGIASASDSVTKSSTQAAEGLDAVNKNPVGTESAVNLKAITEEASNLSVELKRGLKDLESFVSRVATLATGAAAAGVALIALAGSVAKQAQGTSTALEDQTKAQTDANNAQLQATQGAINYQASQSKLFKTFQSGAVDYSTFAAQSKTLNDDYNTQIRTQAKLDAAAAETARENDALQKSLADKKNLNALIDTYGGPLLTSIIALGNQYNTLLSQAKQAFGPAIAGLIDVVSSTISKNNTVFQKFFTDAAAKIDDFVTKNGPAIQKALEAIGALMAAVFNGVIEAAPLLLSLFNNEIIPAFKAVGAAADAVAAGINSVFGTKLTGSFILILTAVTALTGGFRLLFATVKIGITSVQLLVSIFGPWGILIAVVVVALIALASAVDWGKLAASASSAVQAIIGFFKGLPATIGTFFSQLWTDVGALASAAAASVIAAWQTVVDFFASFPTNLVIVFTALWGAIIAGVQSAANGIEAAWNVVVAFFAGLPPQIIGFFSGLWTSLLAGVSAAVQGVQDAWTAIIAFFQGIADQITAFFVQLGQNIVSAIQNAINQVTGFFSGLLASATQFLQPIIDMLKQIAALTSSSGGSSSSTQSSGTVSAAGGGYIRGPGGPVGDKIPAWLSDTEFVMRAKAVKKYGVAFMSALNAGKLDFTGAIHRAAGGLAGAMSGRPMPRMAFAAGGPVSSKTTGVLNLTVGGQEFNGLIMPEDVATKLNSFAIARQTRSAGRKPSWVGSRKQ